MPWLLLVLQQMSHKSISRRARFRACHLIHMGKFRITGPSKSAPKPVQVLENPTSLTADGANTHMMASSSNTVMVVPSYSTSVAVAKPPSTPSLQETRWPPCSER